MFIDVQIHGDYYEPYILKIESLPFQHFTDSFNGASFAKMAKCPLPKEN